MRSICCKNQLILSFFSLLKLLSEAGQEGSTQWKRLELLERVKQHQTQIPSDPRMHWSERVIQSSLFSFPFPPRILQDRGLSSQPGLLQRVLELKETHCSSYLLAFLFDCYEDALENGSQKENVESGEQKETLRKALDVSDLLKACRSFEMMTLLSCVLILFFVFSHRFANFWQRRRTPSGKSTGCFWDVLYRADSDPATRRVDPVQTRPNLQPVGRRSWAKRPGDFTASPLLLLYCFINAPPGVWSYCKCLKRRDGEG